VADFLQAKCDFTLKTAVFAFLSPPPRLGLKTTYGDHLRLIGKPVVDFLLVLIQLLSLGVTAEALRGNILPVILPVWASPGIWLGPRGHADLLSLVNDPSVYILCR